MNEIKDLKTKEKIEELEMRADKSWQAAATQDVENVPLYLMPGLNNYWRQG